MVIDDLDFPSLTVIPAETHPPLLVDADAVLASPVAAQSLQAISRRHGEIIKLPGRIDCQQLPTLTVS
jgi:hypothetical protein